jgi:hypothetical protein
MLIRLTRVALSSFCILNIPGKNPCARCTGAQARAISFRQKTSAGQLRKDAAGT